MIQLKEKLGEKSALLQKEQELNKTLSEEIVNLATTASKADATGVEVPAVEDDVYTEVQSDVHQVEIPPIKEGEGIKSLPCFQ